MNIEQTLDIFMKLYLQKYLKATVKTRSISVWVVETAE